MHTSLTAVVGLALTAAVAFEVGAQQRDKGDKATVLFVCEHGTVKSLLAKTLFEQYAKEVGLQMNALSRGTRADSVVPPWMQRALAADHVSLGAWKPQSLGTSDVANAAYIVSFDVPQTLIAPSRAPRAQWDGLPSVSQDYAKGRDAIKARVHQLVDSLKRAQGVP